MKKKLKGMTLLEIIIAMVVMVICGTLIAETAVGVINMTKTSRTVINTVNSQCANVERRDSVGSVEMTGASGSISISCGAESGNLNVKKYHAPAVTEIVVSTDEEGNTVSSSREIDAKSGDLKYFVLDD